MVERAWVRRVSVYWSHIAGIFLPGDAVLEFSSYQIDAGDVASWPDADLTIVMETGRAQLQRQNSNLEAIRGRAQFLLTLTLAFVGVAVASTDLVNRSLFALIPWGLGIAVAFASAFGAAGVIVARKALGMVDTRLLSQQKPPILSVTARAFADSVGAGETTVATGITVLRDAVALFLLSFVLVCAGWLIALWS